MNKTLIMKLKTMRGAFKRYGKNLTIKDKV